MPNNRIYQSFESFLQDLKTRKKEFDFFQKEDSKGTGFALKTLNRKERFIESVRISKPAKLPIGLLKTRGNLELELVYLDHSYEKSKSLSEWYALESVLVDMTYSYSEEIYPKAYPKKHCVTCTCSSQHDAKLIKIGSFIAYAVLVLKNLKKETRIPMVLHPNLHKPAEKDRSVRMRIEEAYIGLPVQLNNSIQNQELVIPEKTTEFMERFLGMSYLEKIHDVMMKSK